MPERRQSWFLWGLPILLAASVLAGMAIDRPTGADPKVAAEEKKSETDKLPRFDCEDRTSGPYQADPAAQQRQIDWLSDNLDLGTDQITAVRSVIENSAVQADAFWKKTRDEYCDLRDEMRLNVRAELSGEQIRTLDRLLAEYRAKKVAEPATEPEKSP